MLESRRRQEFLEASESDRDIPTLRENTHTGRPLGSPEFVDSLERVLGRFCQQLTTNN